MIELSDLLVIAANRFIDEDFFYRVSALTYATLLAIVPFLAVIVFLMTWFPIFFSNLVLSAKSYILTNFVPTASVAIEPYFQVFINQATQLPLFSIAFLFITAVTLINTIQSTFNNIWKVKSSKRGILEWLFAWIILFFVPIIVGLSVFLTSYISSLYWIHHFTEFFGLTKLLLFALAFFVNIIIFAFMYIVIPNTYVNYKYGLIGAFIAACLFELARAVFTYYITSFPSYELIYGAFSILPIFLLWIYIAWTIILFGALIVYACSQMKTLA